MTILLTGFSGFIGSVLTEDLLDKNFEVIGLTRGNKNYFKDKIFTLLKFNNETDDLATVLKDYSEISHIIHAAALISSKNNSYEDFYQANVQFTNKLLDYSITNNIEHFVFISTNSVFGIKPQDSIIKEKTIPSPSTYYGLTKYIAEKLIEIKLKNKDISSTILRFPAVIGLNNNDGIVPVFINLAQANNPIELFNNGTGYRNILHINDAIESIHRAIKYCKNKGETEIISIGSSNSTTMVDIAKIICRELNSKSEIIPIDKSTINNWDIFYDLNKMKKILKLKTLTVEEGIKKYIKDLKNENI